MRRRKLFSYQKFFLRIDKKGKVNGTKSEDDQYSKSRFFFCVSLVLYILSSFQTREFDFLNLLLDNEPFYLVLAFFLVALKSDKSAVEGKGKEFFI